MYDLKYKCIEETKLLSRMIKNINVLRKQNYCHVLLKYKCIKATKILSCMI